MMKKSDIKMFHPPAHYRTNVSWACLEKHLEDLQDTAKIKGCLGLNLDPDFQRGHVSDLNPLLIERS